MFHIDCFCEDKHVGLILRTLASVGAYNVNAKPAPDAALSGGKVRSKRIEGLNKGASAVASSLNGASEVTTEEIKAILHKAGLAESSYGHVRNELVAKKILKQKSKGHFEVRR